MIENTIKKIEQWVVDRNLHTQDPKVQMCKTVEELGELARAINKGDREKQTDRQHRGYGCHSHLYIKTTGY